MPKVAMTLSEDEVEGIVDDGSYAVGGAPGLYLQVKGAARSWILRIVVGEKRKEIGLGSCITISLAEARRDAKFIRLEVERGNDWVLHKKEIRAETVKKQRLDAEVKELISTYESMLHAVLDKAQGTDAKLLVARSLRFVSATEDRMGERESLSKSYVRSVLVDSGFPKESIPQGVVDLKREHLKVKRFLKGL